MNDPHVHGLDLGGKRLSLRLPRPHDLIQRRILETRRLYETEMLEHARHALRPGDVVVDVGANIGNHTIYFAALCDARVLAFEPHPENLSTLRENVRLNGLESLVTIHAHGLGAEDGTATLDTPDADNLGRCRLQPVSGGAVEVRRFDGLGCDLDVKLVKIDVEGMEREVLRGMTRLLQDRQPALYVEIQDPRELAAIRADLDALGYSLVECFNSTPTWCFLPTRTSEQQFQALMARWDASIRARVRTWNSELPPADRSPLADQLKGLSSTRPQERTHEQTERLAQAMKAIEQLQVQMNGMNAQMERVLHELRTARNARLAPKVAAALRNPKKAWAALLKKLRGRQEPGAAPIARRLDDALVSVVMTSHNSSAFIERAVRSILDQTHANLELIVVDDASTDDTVKILSQLQAADARVRILRSRSNRGTYWSKNLGLRHARGKFVTTQDSDDVSDKDRIRLQLAALARSPHARIATCNYVRVDDRGQVVLNRGLKERLGLITLLFDREETLDRIGYYDSVRTAADAEFLQRLRRTFDKRSFVHVDSPLYIAHVRTGSLSADIDLKAGTEQRDFLSEDRKRYVAAYEGWHATEHDLHIPFPLRRRPFEAPAQMLRGCRWGEDLITASLASIPSRQEGLRKVIGALLDQVDQLNVYLNHYDSVPEFLRHPKIRVARSQDHGDQRDNGKFFFLSETRPGYCLTVDDDIHYPPDYVSCLVSKVQQYGDRAIIGFHGTILPAKIESFFAPNGRTVLSFKHELPDDQQVHLLGTGTTAWHTSAIALAFEDFETKGMADLWLGAKAQQLGVPMIAAARVGGYLRPIEGLAAGSLFEEFARDDGPQTALAQRLSPWRLPAMPEPRPAETTC